MSGTEPATPDLENVGSIEDNVHRITPEEVAGATGADALRSPAEAVAAAEDDRPSWLPEGFEDSESFAREQAAQLNERNAEVARLQAELEQAHQFAATVANDYEADAPGEAYETVRQFRDQQALMGVELAAREAVTAEMLRTVPGLAERLAYEVAAPARFQADVQDRLTETAPDWRDYAPRLQNELATNPHLFPETATAEQVADTLGVMVDRLREERQYMHLRTQKTGLSDEEMNFVQTFGKRPAVRQNPGNPNGWDAIVAAGKNLTYADSRRND